MSDIYFVFKRSDGYVSAIASSSRDTAEAVLRPYTANGFEWSNEILLETTDWPEARDFVLEERGKEE